uniref:LamB/YcsF family protein n=1 Tax=Virgibacillus salexigens TaxID=61016 RepID=UPI00190DA3EA
AEQMKRNVDDQKVKAVDGTIIDLKADTICIHGGGKHAVAFAEALQTTLSNNGITIKRSGEK